MTYARFSLIAFIVILQILVIVLSKSSFAANLFTKQKQNRLASIVASSNSAPIPNEGFQKAPFVSAKSAIVVDAKGGNVMFEKNSNFRHLSASTTKLMTALVALEKCSSENIITVGMLNTNGTQMGLASGDQVTVETLLYGLLMASGNDAAYVLAVSCADSYDAFIDLMNERAQTLEMANTHFDNPAGFDSDYNYSTAADLSKLAKDAVANPLISKIVATKTIVLTDVSGIKTYYVENINKLLDEVDGVEGVKTGHTEAAGEILLTKATREGNTIIVVVLSSQDRFDDSKKLIEWAFANYHWQ